MFRPPDDDAYGRVTRPERYAPLQPFARRLIDELLDEYDAESRREDVGEPGEAACDVTDRTRVSPRSGNGGSIVVGLTRLPGVVLGIGRWHSYHFPRCGCDACDEQLDDLAADMASIVDAFVNGRFTEYLDAGRLGHHWTSPGRSSSGWTPLDPTDPRTDQPDEIIDWSAWPRRVAHPNAEES